MNARVLALMSAQEGLVTRAQAIRSGMSPDQVDRLVRRHRWTAVRTGVYAETAYVASLAAVPERLRLADRAASMRIGSPHVLSHHSAAHRLGLPILQERPPTTHVTRPGIVGSHHRAGIKHHRAPYDAGLVVDADGVPVLGPARTAADIARESGYLPGLVAADSALRLGTTQAELEAAAAAMASWPFVTVVRDVLASCSPDTDSVGETLTRDLVTAMGFGVPEVQFGLTADGRTAWCDLRLGRHVFEFDGSVKYQRADEGGVARRAAEQVLWAEKQRQDWITGFKLGISRLVWDDVLGAGRERTLERLRREYLDTCARFGTDVGDLAAYRARGPRPRPRAGQHRAA